jgi:hypothetical protein
MKFTVTNRNFLFLALMGFYASCGSEDIFDDRRNLIAQTYRELHQQEFFEGEKDGYNKA